MARPATPSTAKPGRLLRTIDYAGTPVDTDFTQAVSAGLDMSGTPENMAPSELWVFNPKDTFVALTVVGEDGVPNTINVPGGHGVTGAGYLLKLPWAVTKILAAGSTVGGLGVTKVTAVWYSTSDIVRRRIT